MHPYTMLAHHLMVPVLDSLRGTRVAKRMAELEQSQWWPIERHREMQMIALKSLVQYAFEQVPYYRRMVAQLGIAAEDMRTIEDVEKLPLLTKDIIHANLTDLLAEDYPRSRMRSSWTGGTTGSRMHFYTTRDNQLSWALPRWTRSMRMMGLAVGDPHVSIRQMTSRPKSRRERLFQWTSEHLQRLTRLDAESVSEENLAGITRAIERAAPCSVAGYPSGLALVAQYIKDSGQRPPHIIASIVGGEQLLPHQRALMREVFGSEPYNRYGSNELLEAAAECPARDGLHTNAEDFIIEVVDEKGHPVEDGQVGRLVFTNLRSYGMPFIRYAIGDIGSLMPGICSCGRNLPRIGPVVGRHIDFLYTRDGRRIAPMQMDMSPVTDLGVTQFRIVQHDFDRLSVTLVPQSLSSGDEHRAAMAGATRRTLASLLRETVDVDVQFAADIKMNISGKRLAVMSEIPLASVGR